MTFLHTVAASAALVAAAGTTQLSPAAPLPAQAAPPAAARGGQPPQPPQAPAIDESVQPGSYFALKSGVNIYLVTLVSHTPLPSVSNGPNSMQTFEQVELQVVKTLHGAEQKTFSLRVQTTNEYGGRGMGVTTDSLAWHNLPKYQPGATLLLVSSVNPQIAPGQVEPPTFVDLVAGEDDPKVKVWMRLLALSELKPAERANGFLAATESVDPRTYDYLSEAALEQISHGINVPNLLAPSDALAIMNAMLLHAAKSGQQLDISAGEVVRLMQLTGVTEPEQLATVKALAAAVTSPNSHTSLFCIQPLWIAIYDLTRSGIEVKAETLLSEEDRRRLEPILAAYQKESGSNETRSPQLIDWLHGKAIPQ